MKRLVFMAGVSHLDVCLHHRGGDGARKGKSGEGGVAETRT
jgi:hypothetical protein